MNLDNSPLVRNSPSTRNYSQQYSPLSVPSFSIFLKSVPIDSIKHLSEHFSRHFLCPYRESTSDTLVCFFVKELEDIEEM